MAIELDKAHLNATSSKFQVEESMSPVVHNFLEENSQNVQPSMQDNAVKLLAFYLPQFHPIPENDDWWGPGFTEWTNVTRGRPMYEGHYQPRRPGNLGYYDLRLPEIRRQQVELARKHGIYGFCYYYYWFSGKRLLEKPLNGMLADPEIDFPFCLCWANETWSRRWDGSESDILIKQHYRSDDPERFIADIVPILQDPRYIRVYDAPMLLIYRPSDIPDLRSVVQKLRHAAHILGIERLHLVAVQTSQYRSALEDGFDAMVEFPPLSHQIEPITSQIKGVAPEFKGQIYSYVEYIHLCLRDRSMDRLPVYRGIMTGWDNTARRGSNAFIFHDANPQNYEAWLRYLVEYTCRHHQGDHRMIFINAWNEWAEGTYLDPDERFGYGYLEATARALRRVPQRRALLEALKLSVQDNAEAMALLHQLEYQLEQRERIIEVLSNKNILTPLFPGNKALNQFRHRDGFHGVIPPRVNTSPAIASLDALGPGSVGATVYLMSDYDVLISGWIVHQDVEAADYMPIFFELAKKDDGSRYYAALKGRERRDDVAASLNRRTRHHPPLPHQVTVFSGFKGYLNIGELPEGYYRLTAILPFESNRRGIYHILHDSVRIITDPRLWQNP